ncbi:SPOR domain-containing protein [Hymenobacter sp. AT01-02]|uniref:HU domain-containing protein n=1 Tax=Hymenobacter sp. AT01-02 TaxID=1571877 RepID=UPI0006E39E0E|nr:SPOR domain-containing protein [Hymenobacter sp. AT01-02]
MLADHIHNLLHDHDCVIIPDFGGLITEYKPARIHPVRHTLAPPTKRVAFNQSLTRNDGLLVDAVARAMNVGPAQARQLVREAVHRMQQELETGQRTELRGVGLFRHAPGRGLEFEYTGKENLLAASFGLPELVSRPIRATDALLARERPTAAPILAASRSKRAVRALQVLAGAVIVGLGLSANYLFADHNGYLPDSWRITWNEAAPASSTNTQPVVTRQQAALAAEMTSSSPRPVVEVPVEAPVAKPLETNIVPTVEAGASKPVSVAKPVVAAALGTQKAPKKAAAKPKAPGWEKARATNATTVAESATIKNRTGRYYIIAGSYTSLANAEKGRQALLRLNRPARVILPQPGSRQYMLSAGDYADRASADRQISILRKRMGNSLWIKNY